MKVAVEKPTGAIESPDSPSLPFSILGLPTNRKFGPRAKDSLWVDADLEVPVPPYLARQ